MYARFFIKQNGSVASDVFSSPNFSFDNEVSGDKLSVYCDDLRFLFLSQINDKEERKLIKVDSLMAAEKFGGKIRMDLDKDGYILVGMACNSDMNASGRTLEIKKLMDEVEKEEGFSDYKSPNPYKNMDKELLKKQYFSLANDTLPATLASGFVKAMEKFRKKRSPEQYEICCVVDTQKPALVFSFGDECEDIEDEQIFHIHRCNKTIIKCAEMVDVIDTLNIGQECCHWLTDAILLAEKQDAFANTEVEILGNYMYGEYEMDVIHSTL